MGHDYACHWAGKRDTIPNRQDDARETKRDARQTQTDGPNAGESESAGGLGARLRTLFRRS